MVVTTYVCIYLFETSEQHNSLDTIMLDTFMFQEIVELEWI